MAFVEGFTVTLAVIGYAVAHGLITLFSMV